MPLTFRASINEFLEVSFKNKYKSFIHLFLFVKAQDLEAHSVSISTLK